MLGADYTQRRQGPAAPIDRFHRENLMSVRFIRLFLLLLLTGWQAAWAESAPATAAPAQAGILKQLEQAPARGLFYEVRKDGKTAYLFGTIHLGKPDFYPLDLATTRTLAQSSELVVELDATQADKVQAALLQHALLPQGQTLDAVLPPGLGRRLNAQLEALGMPAAALQPVKPWMAALALVTGLIQKMGYEPGLATDFYLIRLAGQLGKPVTELESADEQFGLFDRLPQQDQLVFLDESLSLFENHQAQADLQALVAAWLDGDAQTLRQLSLKSLRDSPRSAAWMERVLFDERNARMADKIDQLIAGGRTPFVAVGALHLTGETGLPALLEARGYRVTNLHPRNTKKTP